MEKDSVKTSAAQKAAQKKYDEKTKMLSIKYTPVDMADYEKMREHLEKSGISANQFIKGLIHDYFDPEKKVVAAPQAEPAPAQVESAAPKEAGSAVLSGAQATPENAGLKAQPDKKNGRGSVPEWFD